MGGQSLTIAGQEVTFSLLQADTVLPPCSNRAWPPHETAQHAYERARALQLL
jgi:hypothetical protein